MTKINWTTQQNMAIHALGSDILLTASAGAGKTAVLAQRCLYLLTDAPQRCDVDELLVMTYSEAAAAEMQRRIAQKLNDYVTTNPNDRHIQRQLILLDKANISTVHAFCRSILHEFFYHLPLEPNFEIIDPNESEIVKLQIANDLLEDYYKANDNDDQQKQTSKLFSRFIQSYGSSGSDRPLVQLLIRLNRFLETLVEHKNWIESWQNQLQFSNPAIADNLALIKRQKQTLTSQLNRVIARLQHAESTIRKFPELNFYTSHVNDTLLPNFITIKNLLDKDNLSEALSKLSQLEKLPRLPNRTSGLTDQDIAPVKNIIDKAKKDYKNLCQKYNIAPDSIIDQINATKGFANLLFELHNEFATRYENHKQQQNVLDFADLEHKCLKLLTNQNKPSNIAIQLQNRYRHILLDEYQDISPIQERIIQFISYTSQNLFMVGDVKQSIYGFRQADPDIILKKYNDFTPATSNIEKSNIGRKIDLNENFRSRRTIIDSINYIFSRCMTKNFAGIDYKNQAHLIYGAKYYDKTAQDHQPVELHLIEQNLPGTKNNSDNDQADFKEAIDSTRREAFVIAQRIKQMTGTDHPNGKAEFEVLDPETKKPRPVKYRDVVILLRSMKMKAELFSEVFHQMDIPVHAELTSGYFVATEIQDMLSLLKLLDNPQQDIPLASVLRSPIVSINESQLTEIRLHCPDDSFYHAVNSYADTGQDAHLRQQLTEFLSQLDHWRTNARHGQLAELIWQIYRQTNLLAYVSGLHDGRQRYNNLLHLHDTAGQFDSFSSQGLARFLRFIEKLRQEEGDFGPAPVLTEADNVVRIMSIHKSKGLEFPVVITADLSKKFNKADMRGSFLFDQQDNCGPGMRVVDTETRDTWSTLGHNVVADNLEQRQLAEEMRIQYVAMTRACERLILMASVDLENCKQAWQPWRLDPDTPLPEFLLATAASPMDWFGPALAAHQDFQQFLNIDKTSPSQSPDTNSKFKIITYTSQNLNELLDKSWHKNNKLDTPDILKKHTPKENKGQTTQQIQDVIEQIDWQYPHHSLTKLPARASVTAIKRQQNNAIYNDHDPAFLPDKLIGISTDTNNADILPEPFNKRPRFITDQPQSLTAADKGTITHQFLERLNLTGKLDQTDLSQQLQKMTEQGFFTRHQADSMDLGKIEMFFKSKLGNQLLNSQATLKREWSFTLAIPAAEVYPNEQFSQKDANEPILTRGVIDCLFETKAGITIIDFKTDNITSDQCFDRAATYKTQMQFYRRAVQTIVKTNVTETYLYFLKPSIAVPDITPPTGNI